MPFLLFLTVLLELGLFEGTAWSKQKLLRPVPLNHSLTKKLKKQGPSLVSQQLGEYLTRAEKYVQNKQDDKALDLLTYHYQRKSLTKTEKAQLAIPIAFIYRQKEDTKNSLLYFQKALDSSALDYQQYLLALYNMSQIHIEQGRTKKGLKLLEQWFSVNSNPHPSSYILLAHVYYLKQNLELALKYVQQSLALVDEPKESWLTFPVAIHLRQKNYQKAQPYLERLVALYPNSPQHWKQLAGVYVYLNQPKKALVTLDMAHKMGHLKVKNDWIQLAVLYQSQGLPYQSAQLLKQKITQGQVPKEQKNWELLAESFYQARERKQSLNYLRLASQTAKEPRFFIKYGQRLLAEEQWQTAEQAFKQALNTKGIKQTIKNVADYKNKLAMPESNDRQIASLELSPPNTRYLENIYLNVGVSLYYQKKYTKALEYFRKSIEINDTFIPGYQWIEYAETSLLENKQTGL